MVELGISAGENGCVRGGSERKLRIGAGENGRLAGESIQIWSQAAVGAEKAHAVGAGGVEGDEENVRRMRGGMSSRLRGDGRVGRSHRGGRETYNADQNAGQEKTSGAADRMIGGAGRWRIEGQVAELLLL